MAPKIVLARHVLADVELARKMLPDGFELVGVAPNSAGVQMPPWRTRSS